MDKEEESKIKFPIRNWRAIDIKIIGADLRIWQALWGTDIFINGIPILKVIVLTNVVVWVIMWVLMRWL